MKKRNAIIVALVMVLSLVTTFSATAAPQQGDLHITISPPQTLDGLTFDLHKVFDVRTDDILDGYTYVIAPGFATFPVPGGYTSLRDYLDYVGSLTPTAQEPLLRTLGNNLATHIGATPPARSVVGSGQSVQATGLDAGYYLVITKISATSTIDSVRFALITVSELDDPYVLNIGRKIDAPGVDKEIVGGDDTGWTNAKVGDEIDYQVTASVPGNVDDYNDATGTYIIRDTMVNLTYKPGSLEVTLGGTPFSDYTSTFNPATKVLEIEFDVSELKGHAGAEIVATYTVTLDSTAFINNEAGGNVNNVVVEYGKDSTDTGNISPGPVDPPRVFTFGFDIDKYTMDGATNVKLADAEFELSEAGDALWFTKDTLGRYVLTETPVNPLLPPAGVTKTLISGSDGKVNIRGLDVGTYSLKETKAPDGYVLIDLPIVVTIAHTTGDGVPVIAYTQGGSNVGTGTLISVLNNVGSMFPETGGIGRTIFFIIGGAIMVGSIIVLAIRKKRATAK